MIRARFRMALPPDVWARTVSTRFPDATLRLVTGVPMGDHALELGEVRADDPDAVTDAIRSHADIANYEPLYSGDDRAIGRYEADERSLYAFLYSSSIPPEFPMVVEDGTLEFGLTATREQFDAFGAALEDSGLQYELLSVLHTDAEGRLLTDRQRESLAVAHREGYFAVPRDCTLADVADTLDVDPSSASETIRRGVARVLDAHLLGHRHTDGEPPTRP